MVSVVDGTLLIVGFDGPGINIRAIIIPISGLKKKDKRNIPAKERFFFFAMLPATTDRIIHIVRKTMKIIRLSPEDDDGFMVFRIPNFYH